MCFEKWVPVNKWWWRFFENFSIEQATTMSRNKCWARNILCRIFWKIFTVRHFLEMRLPFDLFLSFSFIFKNVHFEFPQNGLCGFLLLQKCLTLTKTRSRFLEMPHGKKSCKMCLVFTLQWHFEDICQTERGQFALFKIPNHLWSSESD